ncbi:MAG: hypothetical protein ACI9E9_002165 [Reinekea sp.]|jgi:hypothetical protein
MFPLIRRVSIACPNCGVRYTNSHWPPMIAGFLAGVVTAELRIYEIEYLQVFTFPIVFSIVWVLLALRWPLRRIGPNA